MLKHLITDNNLKLIDSYKVSKTNFKRELKQIHAFHPSFEVWNRGYNQMCLEWAVHNACYDLGIKRENTKDCDLNYPQPFWVRAVYAVFGCIVWLFIY